jgi:hypothetical protein
VKRIGFAEDYTTQKLRRADATKSWLRGSKSQMLSRGIISRAAARATGTAAVLFLAVFAATAQDTAPAVPVVDEVYLAKDNGSGKAGEQVAEFTTSDIPIYCVVMLDRAAKVTVKMNFVAVAVTGVKADTKVVTASYTTNEKQNRVNFTGSPDGRWTPGRYRVDIFLDGKPQKQLEFTIKGASSASPAAAKFVDAAPKPKPKPKN